MFTCRAKIVYLVEIRLSFQYFLCYSFVVGMQTGQIVFGCRVGFLLLSALFYRVIVSVQALFKRQ